MKTLVRVRHRLRVRATARTAKSDQQCWSELDHALRYSLGRGVANPEDEHEDLAIQNKTDQGKINKLHHLQLAGQGLADPRDN